MTAELPGELSAFLAEPMVAMDGAPDNMLVLRLQQDLGVRKVAALLPVSREVIADAPQMRQFLDAAIDRHFRPWKYPDRVQWPMFDPFPTLTRWFRLWRHK